MKLSIISLILLAYLPLCAESESGSVTRTCQVLFLDKPVDAPDKAYLFDGKKSHEVSLSSKGFSGVVDLPNGPLSLYFSLNSVSEMEDLAKDSATVQLTEEITDFYLLLRSTPEDEVAPYSLEVVDTSDGKLKPGETLWMNYTKHNIAAEVGSESFQIPPVGRVVSPPPLKESGYYPVHFTFQIEGEGDYHSVLKRTWRYMADTRSLGFVIDAGDRRPQIFTVRDRR